MTLLTAVGAVAQGAEHAHLVPVPRGSETERSRASSVFATAICSKFGIPSGNETSVLLTAFHGCDFACRGLRGKKDYPVTYIMRGLRLQAQGKGDADGNLVAEWVRFDEQDLRVAQALEQTDELAEENKARIAAAEQAAREAAEERETDGGANSGKHRACQ